MLLLDHVKEPLVATDEEAVIAREAAEKLRSVALAGVDVGLYAPGWPQAVPLPARAVALIVAVLTAMAERKPVSVIPHTAELTTQQAADFLNVSRPCLMNLLEKEQIPYRKVGSQRRVLVADLQAFKEKSNRSRQEAIVSMVAEAQSLKLP
jgi:excisionase family DNA binding protein